MAVMGTTWTGEAVAQPLPFPDLLRSNQNMVFSVALRFLRDRAAAEEIAQDVFLELHRHLHELDSEAHATNWLRKVTGRRCIDAARRRKLRMAVTLDDAPEPAVAPTNADPLRDRRLRQLVASLPERARMVVILRYQEEMMPEEIAEALDLPVRTVKSQLTRSLAILRTKFSRLSGGERHG